MSFKTDYKDEIPSGGYPTYNIVGLDGTVIQSDVKIVRSNGNEQDGDAFGAKEVNDIHNELNENESISIIVNKLLSISSFMENPKPLLDELGQYIDINLESEE